MKTLIFSLALIGLICSCSRVKRTTKDVINQSGEVVGKGASEFIEGITEGVDRTLECEIVLSENLIEKGIESGKFTVGNDSIGGHNNVLTIYFIFNKDFNGEITARTVDKKGLEFGRKKLKIEGNIGDTKYIDFTFDKRTYIEVKSKIFIE